MLKTAPWCLGGWLLGTVLQLQQASLWSLFLVSTVGCLVLSVAFLAWFFRNKNSHFIQCLLGALIAFGLALSLVNARCLWQAQQRLDPQTEGKELMLVGIIASLPQQSAISVRFRFQVQSAFDIKQSENVVVPEWVDLAWFQRDSSDLMTGSYWADLKAGDT